MTDCQSHRLKLSRHSMASSHDAQWADDIEADYQQAEAWATEIWAESTATLADLFPGPGTQEERPWREWRKHKCVTGCDNQTAARAQVPPWKKSSTAKKAWSAESGSATAVDPPETAGKEVSASAEATVPMEMTRLAAVNLKGASTTEAACDTNNLADTTSLGPSEACMDLPPEPAEIPVPELAARTIATAVVNEQTPTGLVDGVVPDGHDFSHLSTRQGLPLSFQSGRVPKVVAPRLPLGRLSNRKQFEETWNVKRSRGGINKKTWIVSQRHWRCQIQTWIRRGVEKTLWVAATLQFLRICLPHSLRLFQIILPHFFAVSCTFFAAVCLRLISLSFAALRLRLIFLMFCRSTAVLFEAFLSARSES